MGFTSLYYTNHGWKIFKNNCYIVAHVYYVVLAVYWLYGCAC